MHDASNIGLLKFSFSDQRLVNSRENIDCKRKKNSIKFSEIRESQFFFFIKKWIKKKKKKEIIAIGDNISRDAIKSDQW